MADARIDARFTPDAVLAEGALTRVLAGRDRDGAPVILKRLQRHLLWDRHCVEMIDHEARLHGALRGPGIAPLLAFAREHPERVPPRDSGRELKIVLLDALARSLWQSLGRFEELDADDDLRVSADELRAAIRRSTHAPPVVPLVDGILRTLDADRDGYISRGESDEV
jgi:hypothetical protein